MASDINWEEQAPFFEKTNISYYPEGKIYFPPYGPYSGKSLYVGYIGPWAADLTAKHYAVAQQYTPPQDNAVCGVGVLLSAVGSPADGLTLKLYRKTDFYPDSGELLGTAYLSSVSGNLSWHYWDFTDQGCFFLEANETYFFIFETNEFSESNYYPFWMFFSSPQTSYAWRKAEAPWTPLWKYNWCTPSWCGHYGSLNIRLYSAPSQQNPVISNLNQLKSDNIIQIPESGTTTEADDSLKHSIVVFKATLTDPDNDQIKLEVELKPFNQSFDGQNLIESLFVSSGTEAVITKNDLDEGEYHWRARAVDSFGNQSEWQEFGTVGNVDFKVKLVPLYTQVESPHPSFEETRDWAILQYGAGNYKDCFDEGRGYSSIRSCGCAIASSVMVLRYYDITKGINNGDVNPGNFNDWLALNNGYTPNGNLKWIKVSEYSKPTQSGLARLKFDGVVSFKDINILDQYVGDSKPIILYNRSIGHFLVADGKLSTTHTTRDPRWYKTRYLAQAITDSSYERNYNNHFDGLRLFSSAITTVSGMYIGLASPVEVLVTDPNGLRLGKDPITGTVYDEIPGGVYFQEGISNAVAEILTLPNESKNIWIPEPVDGEYGIRVVGTGLGTYAIDFLIYNNIGESTDISFEAVTNTEVVSDYGIDYSSVPEEPTTIERIVTIQNVITEIEISYQLNLIDNSGIKNSLIKKLNNAQKQLESNRKNTATNILNAFVNEVEVQKEKHINLDTAELLIKDAHYIIEHF